MNQYNEDSIFDVTYEQLSKMTIEEVQDLLFKFYAYSPAHNLWRGQISVSSCRGK